MEGEREVSRKISIYNLDVIISVGYRVKSQVGIEFRKWATQRLKEYLLKGYSINKELLNKEQNKVAVLQKELNTLNEEHFITQKALTDGFLSIISHYSKLGLTGINRIHVLFQIDTQGKSRTGSC